MSARVWQTVAADVLNEPSAAVARLRLASALIETTGADQAARVHLAADGRASWFVTGSGAPETVTRLPPGAEVRQHPLHLHHADTGDHRPVLLPDVLASGRALQLRTRAIMEELGLTLHQMSVPVEADGQSGSYHGWVLVRDGAFDPAALRRAAAIQPLVRGLDRHVRMLAALDPSPEGPLLTPRETVVLALLSRGSTVAGIAARLAISPRTVHKHQEHLYRKLGAVDRLSAVLRAQELGLLPGRRSEHGWPPPRGLGQPSPAHSAR